MRSFRRSLLVRVAFTALLALVVSIALASPSNKWRLECSGGANSDGEIVVHIVPVGGEPVDVRVPITDGTGENHVAHKIRDALKAQLGDAYHFEVDDGEDVLIKKHHGDVDFEVTIPENTVKGTRIHVQKE